MSYDLRDSILPKLMDYLIIGLIVAELENCSSSISTTYTNAHSMQEHVEYLDYTIRVTKNYIEDICKKNHSSLQNEAVKKALERSNYSIRLAEGKTRELYEKTQTDNDSESTVSEISSEKYFQKLSLQSGIVAHSHNDALFVVQIFNYSIYIS